MGYSASLLNSYIQKLYIRIMVIDIVLIKNVCSTCSTYTCKQHIYIHVRVHTEKCRERKAK